MKKKTQLPKINIYNLTDKNIGEQIKTKLIVKHVIKKEDYKKIQALNIIIADARYLKKLNQEFFNRNKPTNVISFNLDNVGEIYISRDEIFSSADFYYYVIHGLLHIMGYDHFNKKTEQLMDFKCREYLKKFFIF